MNRVWSTHGRVFADAFKRELAACTMARATLLGRIQQKVRFSANNLTGISRQYEIGDELAADALSR
ncbi:MAG: hypothetical protein K2Q25_05450 [Mycobacteriaceae bacterium]|nr:hypothetical protein [Mycobacteriaceae bacterium]